MNYINLSVTHMKLVINKFDSTIHATIVHTIYYTGVVYVK